MLRPVKLLSSLHQLRHYLHTKVAELVQPPALHHNRLLIQTTYSTITQPHWSPKAPVFHRIVEQEQQRLLRAIQQQFPIVKVFSAPTITATRPNHLHHISFATQQFRTVVSSSTTTTTTTAANTTTAIAEAGGLFGAGGFFPRTPMVGYRTAAARQFSTVRSPCANLFQQTTGNAGGNHGISHIYSRLFSPAGSKMFSPVPPTRGNEKPAVASSTKTDQDAEQDSGLPAATHLQCTPRPWSGACETAEQDEKASDPKKRSAKLPRYYEYLHHDDLSTPYTPESQRKITVHHWQSSHVKAPPETDPVVYLAIVLDSSPLLRVGQSTDGATHTTLDDQLIGNVTLAVEQHQMHIEEVLLLLDRLQSCGEFRVAVEQGQLHLIFSPSLFEPNRPSLQAARLWLTEMGVDPDSRLFTICEAFPNQPLTPAPASTPRPLDSNNNKNPQASSRSSPKDRSIVEPERSPPHDTLGPDYFKGIHLFLDHVDELLEKNPTFKRDTRS